MIAEIAPRKKPNILVTGTPGTGKTTFSKLLNQSLQFEYVPIGQLIIDHQLYSAWNKEFDVPEFDDYKLLQYLQTTYDLQAGGLIFDFHSPDVFPPEYIDMVVLMRCENQTLYKRLEQRGYKQEKITENVECQIMDEIKYDIEEHFQNPQIVLQFRNQQAQDMQSNIDKALQWLIQYKSQHQ